MVVFHSYGYDSIDRSRLSGKAGNGGGRKECRAHDRDAVRGKAVPVPDNSTQDYSDVPVYYEPFSYAQEHGEVDLYRTSYRMNGFPKKEAIFFALESKM